MYYKVTVIRGHQGTGKRNQTLLFAEKANSAMEAIRSAQMKPGVKHSLMPLACVEISKEEYHELMQSNAYARAGIKRY